MFVDDRRAVFPVAVLLGETELVLIAKKLVRLPLYDPLVLLDLVHRVAFVRIHHQHVAKQTLTVCKSKKSKNKSKTKSKSIRETYSGDPAYYESKQAFY